MTDLEATVARLLDAAGVRSSPTSVSPIDTNGLLNEHFIVDMPDGARYVLRRYGWPWGPTEPFDRMAKEAWLLPLLEKAGVAAPRLIAACRDGQDAALLLSFVDGIALGYIEPRSDAMWRAAGAALRLVHNADIGMGGQPAGMLLDGRVDAFEDGWGEWLIAHVREHATRLDAARPDLAVDVDRCVAVVESARRHLDARPIRLLHNDANPTNVLVDADDTTATWIDWEFAQLGDPLYDFVRLTFGRKRDLGPLPTAAFDGYGEDPRSDPAFELYILGFYLWMANEAREALLPAQATYDAAERYVRHLDEHLDRLS